jgi:hypothetical protein
MGRGIWLDPDDSTVTLRVNAAGMAAAARRQRQPLAPRCRHVIFV